MVYLWSLLPTVLAVSNLALCRASSWHFTDATVSVQGKGAGVGGGFKEKSAHATEPMFSANTFTRFVEHKPLSAPVTLGASDSLKVVLTIQDGKMAKRPHQAFLLLKDTDAGLDISYPFSVKESGKAKVELVCHLLVLVKYLLTISRPRKTCLLNFSSPRNQSKHIWCSGLLGPRTGTTTASFP